MGSVSEEQRRIAQTKQALRRIATGDVLKRGQLFDKRNGKYEGWIGRVLNHMVELGIIEARGEGFARRYRIAPATNKHELRAQAQDNEKIAALLWPPKGEPGPPKGVFAKIAARREVPEPETDPEIIDDDDDDAEPSMTEMIMLLVRLMGGVVEKLDRIERTQQECMEILREFRS